MPAFLGGGEMIRDVRLDGWTPNDIPWKFEAGTPPIVEAIGLGAAIDYLEALGMDAVRQHEIALTGYALRTLDERFGDELVIHGPTDPDDRGRRVLVLLPATCTPTTSPRCSTSAASACGPATTAPSPSCAVLGVGATARASLYVYNDESDIDALADALDAAGEFFAL